MVRMYVCVCDPLPPSPAAPAALLILRPPPPQIEAVLLVSRQGKTRLSKWYLAASLKEKTRMIREITALVLSRPQKQCNFIEFKDKKIVYKRCVRVCTRSRSSPPFAY